MLGGSVADARDLLLEPVRQECARRLPPGMARATALRVLALGERRRRHRRGAARDAGARMIDPVRRGRRPARSACSAPARSSSTAIASSMSTPGARRPGDGAAHLDLSQSLHRPRLHRRARARRRGPDTLEGGDAIAAMARALAALRRHRVLPDDDRLRARPRCGAMLAAVRAARDHARAGWRARAAGASRKQLHQSRIQGRAAARVPALAARRSAPGRGVHRRREILAEIAAARPDVGILTIAPELDGALGSDSRARRRTAITSRSVTRARPTSEALAGIDAGARQATHLFNRMTPLGHRQPGLAGAVLEHDDVTAEMICDGVHVHPGDGARGARRQGHRDGSWRSPTAPPARDCRAGRRSTIGGRPITVGDVALSRRRHDRGQHADDGPRVRASW